MRRARAICAPAAAEGWHLGAAQARGDWLFLLDAGDVPQPHWAQAVERHLMLAPDTAGADPAARRRRLAARARRASPSAPAVCGRG